MFRPLSAVPALSVTLALLAALPAHAQQSETLGWGRLLNNDALGDGEDRWRSGSYVLSMLRGSDWGGDLPDRPGELLEFRLRAETIAPADLITANPADRRYVGALSLGVHTHFDLRGIEASLGVDAVFVGPQTGISSLHGDLHDLIGLPQPTVFGAQIGDGFFPTVTAEFGQTIDLGGAAALRPFVEAQAGVETLLRVGGDLTIGALGKGDLMLRDSTTGQRYRGIAGGDRAGVSIVLGGDIAEVYDSEFFLPGDAVTLADTRSRFRAGMHVQGDRGEAFYGVTWLGKEFEEQVDDQVVGSINLRLKF